MDNMITYISQNLNTFAEVPFNEVDSLALSWLSYIFFPEELFEVGKPVPVRDLFRAEYFAEMFHDVTSAAETMRMLAAMVASPRYREMTLLNYRTVLDNESGTQFAAITFRLLPELYYVAFRGTDYSFAGWKEDMRMSLPRPVEAQTMALQYLEEMVSGRFGSFLTGGHSKGGNLAVYAAAASPERIQDRIRRVYSHDGPGFLEKDLQEEGFSRIRDRISKTIPQSSMIGTVFEQECEAKIVRSNAKGLLQHNPFSWEVKDGAFLQRDRLTPEAKFVIRTMNHWLEGLDDQERQEFIDTIFELLEETGEDNFAEFWENLRENIPTIMRKFRSMDRDRKEFLIRTLGALAVSAVHGNE